jgi:hypothetical protein
MPTNGSSQSGSGTINGCTRSQQPYTEGVAKATVKHREEQANKEPSARTTKVKAKKARTKERNDARKSTDEYQARKAMWQGQQFDSNNSVEGKRAKTNKRNDRKFAEARGMEGDFD